jgi:hypothetical protein
MKAVEVRKSQIQGTGVYALKDFDIGEVVLDIDDSDIVTDPSKLSAEDNEFNCDYLDNGKIILMKDPERSINHSCDPSTYVKTIDGIRKVIAKKKINVGDEVTYDYAINGENAGTFPCHCGSKKCRKIYVGNFFKLPRELQIEYLPFLDDWFKNRHKTELDKLK